MSEKDERKWRSEIVSPLYDSDIFLMELQAVERRRYLLIKSPTVTDKLEVIVGVSESGILRFATREEIQDVVDALHDERLFNLTIERLRLAYNSDKYMY